MSLKYEQCRSLKHTRQLLRDLLDPKKTPKIPKSVRNDARQCLKHFPFLNDHGMPDFSDDPFTDDDGSEKK